VHERRGFFSQVIEWLESGAKSAAEVLALCSERIRAREADIRAWVEVAPQAATGAGALAGVPFGVKDIFETRGLATEYGSPLYAGRKGETDACLVAELRVRGGVLMGKTQTTAFAYFDPAPTRNPRDLRRTPGGSSSGSAAAVAARMVPFALGTQTVGSVIRPASYCGITGFKPTFGLLSLEGVMPFAPSLDTAGLFTETAEDMEGLWGRIGRPAGAAPAVRVGALEPWAAVDGVMSKGYARSLERLQAAGFACVRLEPPVDFGALRTAVATVAAVEAARSHRARWEQFGERLGAQLAELVRRGLAAGDGEYQDALGLIAEARRALAPVFDDCPVLLSPAATGAAPEGLASTGDPALNAPWTGLGGPVVAVPMASGGEPPLGLQLAAAPGADAVALATAVAIERYL
jgi:Asp-tRNA(Asn)/Glu-tRNA(Gln) amidotransferase A subunit family amidase